MLRLVTGLLLLAAILVGGIARHAAAQAPPGERRVALVIGDSAYVGAGRLANPASDARAIADVLRGLGFDVELALDVGYLDLTRAIRRFGDRIETAHVALFYFAGHGLQVGGSNFLVPVDAQLANERDVRFETVDLSSVIDLMRGPSPRVNLIFLDACRDNPLARAMTRTNQTRQLSTNGLAPTTASGMLIAFSTEPGSVSVDGAGDNSPFAAALVQQMPVPGVEVRQMLTRVRQSVRQATGGRQVTWDHSSLESEFYFAGGPASPAGTGAAARGTPPDIELVFWQSIMSTGTAAELELFLRQFPQGRFAELAGLRLAALRAPPTASAGIGPRQGDGQRSAGAEGDPAQNPSQPQGERRFALADIPFVNAQSRRQLAEYERRSGMRALALASDGTLAWRSDQSPGAVEADIRRQAVESCEYVAQRGCRVYAVGDRVDPAFAEAPAIPSLRIAPGPLDVVRIPFLSAAERERVRSAYLAQADRKALAISPTGVWGATWGVSAERAARAEALRRCEEFDGRRGLCVIYAIGNTVVESWP